MAPDRARCQRTLYQGQKLDIPEPRSADDSTALVARFRRSTRGTDKPDRHATWLGVAGCRPGMYGRGDLKSARPGTRRDWAGGCLHAPGRLARLLSLHVLRFAAHGVAGPAAAHRAAEIS